MTYHFYILYSLSIDRYYIGHTNDLPDRIKKHNTSHKGFTRKANDWKLAYSEEYDTKELAYKRERQIKGWKNRKRVEELIRKSN